VGRSEGFEFLIPRHSDQSVDLSCNVRTVVGPRTNQEVAKSIFVHKNVAV
jgi:hypothetical protein